MGVDVLSFLPLRRCWRPRSPSHQTARPLTSIISYSSSGFSSGDFAFYDHVLDTCAQLNIIPERYTKNGLSPLDVSFGESRRFCPFFTLFLLRAHVVVIPPPSVP